MRAPDGRVVADPGNELPGRGIWVTPTRAAVSEAMRRKLFARAARDRVEVDEGFPDVIESLLLQRCLGYLGLARRAGQLVSGFERVQAALDKGLVNVLLVASDAGPHGRKKQVAKGGKDAPVRVELLSRQELSLALGKENVVHAALLSGGLAARFLRECNRLAGFRENAGTRDSDDIGTT